MTSEWWWPGKKGCDGSTSSIFIGASCRGTAALVGIGGSRPQFVIFTIESTMLNSLSVRNIGLQDWTRVLARMARLE